MSSIELEHYEIDVQALMRGLVHELRNPLSAILTASSLLEGQSQIDEEGAMLLDVVTKESKRMNRILTEFSHFVKPPKPHAETFDLALLTREVVDEMSRDGSVSGSEIVDSLPASIMAWGDAHHVGVAIRHIIHNAAESVDAGGSIELSASHKDDMVSLAIEDNGPGLPGDAAHQAFQPFFSTKPSSTGLGLPIARMTLRASGGDVTVENRESTSGVLACLVLPASPR